MFRNVAIKSLKSPVDKKALDMMGNDLAELSRVEDNIVITNNRGDFNRTY